MCKLYFKINIGVFKRKEGSWREHSVREKLEQRPGSLKQAGPASS